MELILEPVDSKKTWRLGKGDDGPCSMKKSSRQDQKNAIVGLLSWQQEPVGLIEKHVGPGAGLGRWAKSWKAEKAAKLIVAEVETR